MTTAVVHPGDALHPGRRLATVVILGVLVALGPFTIDLYLPAFPVGAVVVRRLRCRDPAHAVGDRPRLRGRPAARRPVERPRRPARAAARHHERPHHSPACSPPSRRASSVLGVLRRAAGRRAPRAAAWSPGDGPRPVRRPSAREDARADGPDLRRRARARAADRLPAAAVLDWRGLFVCLAFYGVAALAAAAIGIGETRPLTARDDARTDTPARATARSSPTACSSARRSSARCSSAASSPTCRPRSFLFQEVYGFTPQQYGLLFAINSIGVIGGVAGGRAGDAPGRPAVDPRRHDRRAGGERRRDPGARQRRRAPAAACSCRSGSSSRRAGSGSRACRCSALAHHGEEAGTAASLLGAVNFGLAGAALARRRPARHRVRPPDGRS